MIRFYINDDLPQASAPSVIYDESDSWWGGVQKCAAAVAIAATLVIAAASTQASIEAASLGGADDLPAGQLYGQPDEDFYQPPPAWPVVFEYPQSWSFEQNEPAGSLAGQPDEDFWQNPVAPVVWPNACPQPWSFEQNENAAGLFGQPDEDFYEPPPPWPIVFIYPQQASFEQNENAAGLYGQPDEDFYEPPPAWPVSFQYPQPWAFDPSEIVPASAPPLVPDEDFWANPVAPVPGSNFQRLPYLPDVEELPAGFLHGQPDEDYFVQPVAPVTWPNQYPQPWSFDQSEIVPAAVVFQPDEDYWIRPAVQPASANAAPQPWTFDQQEVCVVPGDEDYFFNPIAPASWTNRCPQLWAFDPGDYVPPPVPLPVDELYWQNPVAPVTYGHIWLQPYLVAEDSDQYAPPVLATDFLYATAGSVSQVMVCTGGGVNVTAAMISPFDTGAIDVPFILVPESDNFIKWGPVVRGSDGVTPVVDATGTATLYDEYGQAVPGGTTSLTTTGVAGIYTGTFSAAGFIPPPGRSYRLQITLNSPSLAATRNWWIDSWVEETDIA
jgi:hypothetical protein